jgi:hypothetical protein
MNEHVNNRMVKRREPKTRARATAREILGGTGDPPVTRGDPPRDSEPLSREFRKARHAELEPETAAHAAARLAEEAMSHPSQK